MMTVMMVMVHDDDHLRLRRVRNCEAKDEGHS